MTHVADCSNEQFGLLTDISLFLLDNWFAMDRGPCDADFIRTCHLMHLQQEDCPCCLRLWFDREYLEPIQHLFSEPRSAARVEDRRVFSNIIQLIRVAPRRGVSLPDGVDLWGKPV